ncbi:unnamed protein product [Heterobilharzia americana]|nr:unnamed protein product [Heterobilharzia americana]
MSSGDNGPYADSICGAGNGRLILTGSFDHTVCLWDVRTGERTHHLIGHAAEVSSASFTYDTCFVATASMDKTVRWRRLASASADGTARVWHIGMSGETKSAKFLSTLIGHEGEVSKVCFNSRGSLVMTASADKTARLWDSETGELKDILSGHTDEVFSCAFNYESDTIITGSKDNTCRIWK